MNRKQKLCIVLTFCLCMSAAGGGRVQAAAKKISVHLNKKKQTIYVGEKKKIKAVVRNGGKKTVLVWKSLNQKVAAVTAKGVVTGKKAGKAKIQVKIKGKKSKAVCTVTVKKKESAKKPAASQEPAESPTPTASPVPDGETPPGTTPLPPEDTGDEPDATETPGTEAGPGATETPGDTGDEPGATETPGTEDGPGATEAPGEQLKGPVAAVKSNGTETVYILYREYDGAVHIAFAGEVFSTSGKVKEALSLLSTSYITRTNHAGTIRVSRTYPSTSWELTDLRTNRTYTMTVESRYEDPAYPNCGAIRFAGDVTADIQVY